MSASESSQALQLAKDYTKEQLALMYIQERKKSKMLQQKVKEIELKSKNLVSWIYISPHKLRQRNNL